ncbi:amino acid adenylation domain-containing protein [Paractinoplanes rhizophilus]|uniref:Amino acid adenylation domain-containing protein n=1 Tax=Paractinoplanes rhizophilus TaxID=1416877 RepID=A0ABW2HXQ3_9ACTN
MSDDVFLLPTSFGQDRMWLMQQLAPAATAYHLAVGLEMTGPLDVGLLRASVRAAVARHEALRTTFGLGEHNSLVQVVRDSASVDVPLRDLIGRPGTDLDRIASALVDRPFDLAAGPLLRVELVRTGVHEHRLLLCAHHIVADGWSLARLAAEIGELYRAGRDRDEPDLPGLTVQHADWAVWQREWADGPDAAGGAAYWRDSLAGAAALELPADRARPAVPRFRGGEVPLRIPAATGDQFAGLGATAFMVLAAALAVTWSRWSGQEDLVFGTPVAGRTLGEVEPLVGNFVNTLPLRADLTGDPSFRELLARIRATCLGAYAHQQVPFERLTELAGGDRRPLIRTLLAIRERLETRWPGVPELTLRTFAIPTGGAQLDVAVYLEPDGTGGWTGELVYDEDLFDRATAESMAVSFTTVLTAAVAAPDTLVRHLPVTTRPHHAADGPPPCDTGLLHAAFERQAAAHPDAPAMDGHTYGELDRAANRLARTLGAGRGDIVGICLSRSPDMVVAILAVLKAGAAYLPLDPGYPPQRLRFMVEDSGAPLVVTDRAGAEVLAGTPVRLIDVRDVPAGTPDTCPAVTVTPRDLAYVIYTSGSTGRPKGAMNEHAAVANRIAWMQAEYGLEPGEAVLQKTPLSFDVSGWEVHWPLAAGGRIVLARPDGHRDPGYLARLIAEREVTTVHFVPSMLRVFLADPGVRHSAGSLRRIVCSGEELPRDLAAQCLQVLPGVALHNLYGPTEAAIDVTFAEVSAQPGARVPIGRPIAGASVHVLDRHGTPVAAGAVGELHLGGIAVGRGYHRRPALTAQRFVPDPHRPGGRLYRTGDLVRWRPDGNLEFLGRLDQQVKIRGHRIETGEIETVLAAHPAVGAAAVLALPDSTGGARLAAYVTGGADPVRLRRYLRSRLPEAMIPAVVIEVGELPLTPSGKLDRGRLPALGAQPAGAAAEPPRGDTEEVLAEIWREVLERPVGVEDDFYDLGGDSLRAVAVLARARDRGLSLPVALLLGNHTIRDLATSVGEMPHTGDAVVA